MTRMHSSPPSRSPSRRRAGAQNYPTKPVTLFVPFAAGGPTDTVARSLAQAMGKALGGTIVVENVPGAGGTIAPTKLKGAAPDGYTLMLAHIGMSTAPALYRSLPFKPLEDFEHVGQVVDVPMTFIGKKDLPPNDFKSLVDYARANKDKVDAGERRRRLRLAPVRPAVHEHHPGRPHDRPVQGHRAGDERPARRPGGHHVRPDDQHDELHQVRPHQGLRGRRRRPASTRSRSCRPPPRPLPGFEVSVWHGVYAPKGTPKPVIDKLVAALQAAIADPQFIAKMNELGSQVVSKDKATPDGLRTHLKAEIDKWTPIIRKAGVYAD